MVGWGGEVVISMLTQGCTITLESTHVCSVCAGH